MRPSPPLRSGNQTAASGLRTGWHRSLRVLHKSPPRSPEGRAGRREGLTAKARPETVVAAAVLHDVLEDTRLQHPPNHAAGNDLQPSRTFVQGSVMRSRISCLRSPTFTGVVATSIVPSENKGTSPTRRNLKPMRRPSKSPTSWSTTLAGNLRWSLIVLFSLGLRHPASAGVGAGIRDDYGA